MIKQILTGLGFLIGILLSSYLLASLVAWSIDIAVWHPLIRASLILFAVGIFGTFTKIGNKLGG